MINNYTVDSNDTVNDSCDCDSVLMDIKCLSDQELLQFIFSCQINSSDLQHLLKSFNSFKELFFADSDRIKLTENIEIKTNRLLQCIKEIIERSLREKLKSHPVLKSLHSVLEYCRATMSVLPTEQLRVIFLNSENMILFETIETYGTVNEIAIYNRNIIKKALILEATGIILIHNHPSTSLKPSHNDIILTQKLAYIAEQLEISLLDHIIIGGNYHFSMKKHGII